MIQINLLPEERRPVERTPLPRFLAIVAGVLVGFIQILFLVHYHASKIPNRKLEIVRKTEDRDNHKMRADEVDKIMAEIQGLEGVRKTLGDLESDRVCWGRILDRLCDSVPDNLWIKNLAVQRGPGAGGPGEKRRYVLRMQGVAVGDNDNEARRCVTDFIRNLTNRFMAKDPDAKAPTGAEAAKLDYDPKLAVRAFEPYLQYMRKVQVPVPAIKERPAYTADGMDFATDLTIETVPYSERVAAEQKAPQK